MAGAKIGVVLALDGEQKFSAGVRSAQASVKLCNQELRNLEAESRGSANTLESLTKRQDALRKAQDACSRTLTAAKEGQANATRNYREAAARLEELRKKLDAAEKELKENGGANGEAAKEAEAYRKAVERQSTELLKAEAALSNWDTRVAKAEGDVRKAGREVEANARHLDEARASADGCATSIDGFGKAVKSAGDKAESSSGQIASASEATDTLGGRLSSLGNIKAAAVIAGVGAAAVAAGKKILEAGKAAAAYADEVLTASDITGMTTDRIQEITYAAGLMDTSLETVEGAMRKNISSMRSAAKGTGEAAASYARLGVSVKKADGTLRDSEDVFWDCVDALGRIEDRTERDAAAMQLFGKSAQDLNPLIAKGSTGFRELAREAHEAGYVLDSETLGRLGRAQDSLDRLEMAGKTFGNTVGAAVAPALGALADLATAALNGIAGAFRDNRTEAEKLAGSLKESTSGAQRLLDGARGWKEEAAQGEGELEAYRKTLLEVVKAEEADEYQKAQVSQIVGKLKDTVPELSDAWDEQKGVLRLTAEEVNSLIDAQEDYIRQSVLVRAKKEAYEALARAQLDAAKAQGLIDSRLREASEAAGKEIRSIDELKETYTELNRASGGFGGGKYWNLVNLAKDAEAAKEALDAASPVIEDAKKQVRDLDEAAKIMGADLSDAGESAGGGLGNVADAAGESMPRAAEAVEGFAGSAKEMADAVQSAFDDAHKAAEGAFSVEAFEAWAKDAENGMAKAGEAFEKQAEVLEEYASNFATVSERLRVTEPEFLSYIQELGKDGAQLVDELASAFRKGDTEAVESFIGKYRRAMDARGAIADTGAKNVVALKKAEGEFGSALEEWEGLETAVLKVRNSGLPEEVGKELLSALTAAKSEGVKIPEGLADAISSSTRPAEAANICIAQLKNAIASQKEAVASAAGEIGSGIGSAIEAELQKKYGPVADAATGLINIALVKARARAQIGSPSKLFRQEVGQFLAAGVAEGIRDGNTLTAEAASEQMTMTLAAMKKWLSKNRAGTEEIAQTWQATATAALKNSFGIRRTKDEGGRTVAKSQNEYASEVLSTATAYLANLKQLYDVSTREELSYWNSVKAHLKSGTQAWVTASGKVRALRTQASKEAKAARAAEKQEAEKASADLLSRMEAYISHREAMGKLTAKQERRYWERQRAEFEAGSSEYRKISEKLVALDAKAAAERLASMESYLSHREAMGRLSTRQERDYWQKHIDEFEKGSAEYREVQERLVALEARLVSERLQKYEAYISRQTALRKMSITREKEYWTRRLAEFKKGSDEYKEIEERVASLKSSFGTADIASSVLSAYQTYFSMSEKAELQYWANIRRTYKAGTADRLEADRQYIAAREKLREKESQIEADYTARIEEATRKYRDAVKARRDAIYGAFGLFDEFESSSATGGELLFNLKSQAEGYEAWARSISELEGRGIFSEGLLSELREKGPSDIAAIKALLSLTDEQMKEYQEAYDRKGAASERQAKAESKDLKAETKEEIRSLKAGMKEALAAANEPITDELRAVATKIQSVAEDQTAAIVAAFTQGGAKAKNSTGTSVSSGTRAAAGVTGDQTNGLTKKQTEEEKEREEAARKAAHQAEAAADKARDEARLKATTEADQLQARKNAEARAKAAEEEERKGRRIRALDAIRSAKKLEAPLTAEQRKAHAKVFLYLADKYGVAGSTSLYARLASAFGLPDYRGTGPERMAILEKLKEHGLRAGTTRAGTRAAWMDEDISTVGPEIIVRRSDKAILTRLEASDAVIPANLARNLFAWGAIDPASVNMAALNERLAGAFDAQARASAASTAAVERILSILGDYLPHLADGRDIRLDTGALVGGMAGEMSRELARRARRNLR